MSNSNEIIEDYWPFLCVSSTPPSSKSRSYCTLFYPAVLFFVYLIGMQIVNTPDSDANCTLRITPDDERVMREFTGHLHSENRSVKAFLAIGGAGKNAEKAMSAMACEQINRRVFIRSAIEVARNYDFDGVDLDWEFPSDKIGGMNHLAYLFTELREAVVEEARQTGKSRLEISAAVYFNPDLELESSEGRRYPTEEIVNNVDFVNVLCYDYAGFWDTSRTGSLSAIYHENSPYCTSFGIRKWKEAGLPPKKMVMGLPLFGRTWKLIRDEDNNGGIGATAVGTGPEDSAQDKGCMLYRNVVTFNLDH
ncbi:hypothetical protein MKW94_017317 [Papaver nudicaule]|uniref:GH18 domain-containing protein n=1 Tax=Papaver nudicaule TaxID=74823 RepID=A0AA41VBP3_PAPNU|nr:hypothetical protein [Papaver nudicaule]